MLRLGWLLSVLLVFSAVTNVPRAAEPVIVPNGYPVLGAGRNEIGGRIDWMGDAPRPGPGSPSAGTPGREILSTRQTAFYWLVQWLTDFRLTGVSWIAVPSTGNPGQDWTGDVPKPSRPR